MPSSLLAFLSVASRLSKFKLLRSLGWPNVEIKVLTVVSVLAESPHSTLAQNSHCMTLLIVGMSNQKSKFHTSSRFGNSLLASCHLASCQGNSLPSGEVLAAQTHGSRSDGSGLQYGGWRYGCPTQHCSLNLSVLFGMQLKWAPLNSFLAEILLWFAQLYHLYHSSCISSSLLLSLLCQFKCIYF